MSDADPAPPPPPRKPKIPRKAIAFTPTRGGIPISTVLKVPADSGKVDNSEKDNMHSKTMMTSEKRADSGKKNPTQSETMESGKKNTVQAETLSVKASKAPKRKHVESDDEASSKMPNAKAATKRTKNMGSGQRKKSKKQDDKDGADDVERNRSVHEEEEDPKLIPINAGTERKKENTFHRGEYRRMKEMALDRPALAITAAQEDAAGCLLGYVLMDLKGNPAERLSDFPWVKLVLREYNIRDLDTEGVKRIWGEGIGGEDVRNQSVPEALTMVMSEADIDMRTVTTSVAVGDGQEWQIGKFLKRKDETTVSVSLVNGAHRMATEELSVASHNKEMKRLKAVLVDAPEEVRKEIEIEMKRLTELRRYKSVWLCAVYSRERIEAYGNSSMAIYTYLASNTRAETVEERTVGHLRTLALRVKLVFQDHGKPTRNDFERSCAEQRVYLPYRDGPVNTVLGSSDLVRAITHIADYPQFWTYTVGKALWADEKTLAQVVFHTVPLLEPIVRTFMFNLKALMSRALAAAMPKGEFEVMAEMEQNFYLEDLVLKMEKEELQPLPTVVFEAFNTANVSLAQGFRDHVGISEMLPAGIRWGRRMRKTYEESLQKLRKRVEKDIRTVAVVDDIHQAMYYLFESRLRDFIPEGCVVLGSCLPILTPVILDALMDIMSPPAKDPAKSAWKLLNAITCGQREFKAYPKGSGEVLISPWKALLENMVVSCPGVDIEAEETLRADWAAAWLSHYHFGVKMGIERIMEIPGFVRPGVQTQKPVAKVVDEYFRRKGVGEVEARHKEGGGGQASDTETGEDAYKDLKDCLAKLIKFNKAEIPEGRALPVTIGVELIVNPDLEKAVEKLTPYFRDVWEKVVTMLTKSVGSWRYYREATKTRHSSQVQTDVMDTLSVIYHQDNVGKLREVQEFTWFSSYILETCAKFVGEDEGMDIDPPNTDEPVKDEATTAMGWDGYSHQKGEQRLDELTTMRESKVHALEAEFQKTLVKMTSSAVGQGWQRKDRGRMVKGCLSEGTAEALRNLFGNMFRDLKLKVHVIRHPDEEIKMDIEMADALDELLNSNYAEGFRHPGLKESELKRCLKLLQRTAKREEKMSSESEQESDDDLSIINQEQAKIISKQKALPSLIRDQQDSSESEEEVILLKARTGTKRRGSNDDKTDDENSDKTSTQASNKSGTSDRDDEATTTITKNAGDQDNEDKTLNSSRPMTRQSSTIIPNSEDENMFGEDRRPLSPKTSKELQEDTILAPDSDVPTPMQSQVATQGSSVVALAATSTQGSLESIMKSDVAAATQDGIDKNTQGTPKDIDMQSQDSDAGSDMEIEVALPTDDNNVGAIPLQEGQQSDSSHGGAKDREISMVPTQIVPTQNGDAADKQGTTGSSGYWKDFESYGSMIDELLGGGKGDSEEDGEYDPDDE